MMALLFISLTILSGGEVWIDLNDRLWILELGNKGFASTNGKKTRSKKPDIKNVPEASTAPGPATLNSFFEFQSGRKCGRKISCILCL